MNILSISEVSKKYGKHTALRSISLEIPKGSTYGLLGPNGAGKTSLIRIINQITAPDRGQVLFEQQPLHSSHVRQIGYLPEERGLYPKMRVHEQLLYFARLRGMNKEHGRKEINAWLDRFDMLPWQNSRVEELSKGMAQKIQFIATVLHKPKLLILDEPFTGFDPINTNLIKKEILKLRDQGATVIFSTHRMESVEEVCDEIALINKGELVLKGKLRDVKQDFKSHTYRCEIESSDFPKQLSSAIIISSSQQRDTWHLTLTANGTDSNQIIAELMQYGTLHHFSEELPSLNDIFIKKVQEA